LKPELQGYPQSLPSVFKMSATMARARLLCVATDKLGIVPQLLLSG